MDAPRVVLSARLPAAARARLVGCEVVEPESGSFERGRLLELLAEADGAVTLLSVRVDRELLAAAPRLRVVGNFAVGVNNVDLDEATRRNVAITNTPDVLTDATADLAFGLMIAAARRFSEGESLARSGRWGGWEPEQLLGRGVFGATLGLVGFGRIGQAVARRAAGFSMRVLYASRRRAPEVIEAQSGARHVALDELLAHSDIVSIHVPLSDETRHLVGARELARMPAGAVLVNTARGPIVDEAALAAEVVAGRLACGLDVYEDEPAIHPSLRAAAGAVLLPHLGSATREARDRMAALAAGGVADVLAGRRPAHLVNPSVAPWGAAQAAKHGGDRG